MRMRERERTDVVGTGEVQVYVVEWNIWRGYASITDLAGELGRKWEPHGLA